MKTFCITIFAFCLCTITAQASYDDVKSNLYYNDNPGDSLSKTRLKTGGALIPVLEDFDFDFYATIRSFVISYTQNDQVYETKIRGNIIPKEQITQLCKLKSGTRINFDNIEVNMPDGTIRSMSTHYFLKR